MPRAGRKQDEELLHDIKLRSSGMSLLHMQRVTGKSTASLTTQTNKVMNADLAESGENPRSVASAYWYRKPK